MPTGGRRQSGRVTDGDVAVADLNDPLALETLQGPSDAGSRNSEQIGDGLLRERHNRRGSLKLAVEK